MTTPSASERRLMLFVDGSNLTRGAKEYGYRNRLGSAFEIDIEKFVRALPAKVGGGRVVGGYYFSGFARQGARDADGARSRIERARLRPVSYQVDSRPMACPVCKQHVRCSNAECQHHREQIIQLREKFVDVDLALHAWKDKDEYDVACIASGDGDFLPLVRMLQKHGKEAKIVAFSNKIHKIYWSDADVPVSIDDWAPDVARGGMSPPPASVRLPTNGSSPEHADAAAAAYLVTTALSRAKQPWVAAAGLKSQMLALAAQIGVVFSERSLGVKNFLGFLEKCSQAGLLEIDRSTGHLRVRLSGAVPQGAS